MEKSVGLLHLHLRWGNASAHPVSWIRSCMWTSRIRDPFKLWRRRLGSSHEFRL